MSTNSRITNQLKAIIIFEFLNSYNKLEIIIRSHFEKCLDSLEKEKIYELHFLSGGLIGTFIDYNNPMALKLRDNPFKVDSKFKELNTNQILKINRKSNLIPFIKKDIASVQTKMAFFTIEDCIIKLLEMRNILAHDIINCTFREKHIIEVFTLQKINELNYPFLEGYDLNLLDNMSINVLSNYFYMERIIATLEVESSN